MLRHGFAPKYLRPSLAVLILSSLRDPGLDWKNCISDCISESRVVAELTVWRLTTRDIAKCVNDISMEMKTWGPHVEHDFEMKAGSFLVL
jgi:hypothetical protein